MCTKESEKLNKNADYYIGLDMGTSSAGWAVSDSEYNLIRRKGKDLWGVRQFEEAKTAAERRGFRVARRRKQRQQVRNRLLSEEFQNEITKIDSGFLKRMEDSRFVISDKRVPEKYTLFNDSGYTDVEYYNQYPTIYHLRKALIESNERFDIRLVFLGIHSLFQHPGHFLDKGDVDTDNTGPEELIQFLEDCMNEIQISIPLVSNQKVLTDILTDSRITRRDKEQQILEILQPNKESKKAVSQFVKVLTGQKAKLGDLIMMEDKDTEEYKYSFSFREKTLEEILPDIEGVIDGLALEYIESIYSLYSWSLLNSYMKDTLTGNYYSYLAEARVAAYDKHHSDLVKLKTLFREYIPEEYDNFFRKMEKANYSHYIGSTEYDGEKRCRTAKAKQEDFYKSINKMLEKIPECSEKTEIQKEIIEGTFLLKQTGPQNGFVPNQLQLKELRKILQNASKHYPFLTEKDERDMTAIDRIEALFSFRIPYYIGPLKNTDNQGHGWAVRRDGHEQTPVRPWNFEEIIDESASADLFIKNLVNSCTYLRTEKVLPKSSLLYQEFEVLNELNNLRINGMYPDEIQPGLKRMIFEQCFYSGKKVTGKKLQLFLRSVLTNSSTEEFVLTGIDKDFKSSLSSYKKFCELFGVKTLNDTQKVMAEQIIEWSTVYGDSRKFLKRKLEDNYPELTDQQIRRIAGFKFSEWGNLSRAFLEMEGYKDEAGNPVTIIRALRDTQKNLMQLLSNDSAFAKKLQELNDYVTRDIWSIEPDDLDGMYLSAPVRRMIWQTFLILREVVDTIGYSPKKIFMEMARGEQEKKRTASRKKQLIDLYKEAGMKNDELFGDLESLEEAQLRSKKLYLYFRQMGRDIYSGKPIDFMDVLHGNRYDIDHIHPQSKKKDDSLENNLVLTSKDFNNHIKQDVYPIPEQIQSRQKGFWAMLLKQGFMSQEKYNRLMRTTPFTDEELAEFVNRQLVETRQGTKAIISLINQCFPDSEVVYVKAGNTSDFRQRFDIPKSRDLNNYHHAVDAYLNIVVGNVYDTKFTKNPINFIKKMRKSGNLHSYSLRRMYDFNVQRGDQTAWVAENDTTLKTVKKTAFKTSPMVTKRTYERKGGLADSVLTAAKKAKPGVHLPVKTSDSRFANQVSTYGGYDNVKGSHFFLVEHQQKKKTIRSIENVPIHLKEKLKTKEELEHYCAQVLGMVQPDVRLTRIPMYSLLLIDGYYYYLTGRTGGNLSLSNAVELCLPAKEQAHIRMISKIAGGRSTDALSAEAKDDFRKKNLRLYGELAEKHRSTIFSKRKNPIGPKLLKYREAFVKQTIENQCKVILQILKLTSTNCKTSADLKLIGGSGQEGVMSISKLLRAEKYAEFYLICQSPSGIYETRKNLLTI